MTSTVVRYRHDGMVDHVSEMHIHKFTTDNGLAIGVVFVNDPTDYARLDLLISNFIPEKNIISKEEHSIEEED